MTDKMSSLGSYERKLRYRKLLDNVEQLDDTVNNADTILKATHIVEEAESLLRDGALQEKAVNPGEGLLDSRVLLASSNVMTKLADSVSGNTNVYDPDELAEHIKSFPQYWSSIRIPKRIDDMIYLHGSFVPGPPEERPERQRRQLDRQTTHATKEPESVKNKENPGESSEEASESVLQIKKFVTKYYKTNGMQPFSYFRLVLDPNSFAKTVENIYHTSFLVRDGLVSITIDENTQLPFIAPTTKKDRQKDSSDEQSENNQFIISLDMDQWQEAVKVFRISEPLLKF